MSEQSTERVIDAALPDQGAAIGQLASTIEPCSIDWIEPGFLARGQLHDISGDPGVGKSTTLVHFAARISRGLGLFDNSPRTPGNVVIVSFEDDAPNTIVPRLVEAVADLTKIRIIGSAVEVQGLLHPITLPEDIVLLEAAISADGAKFVIIDPITACLSDKVDSFKDASVRKVLAELAAMAQRTGAAVLSVRHLNKNSSNGSAMYRASGSIAFTAAPRVTLLVGFDPTDRAPEAEKRRVLACVKSNLGPKPASRAFRLRGSKNSEVSHVEWVAGPCSLSADDLLRPRHERKPEAYEEACAFLSDFLADGRRSSDEVDTHAAELGISDSTLRRARKKLGVRCFKKGFGGTWFLELPADDAEQTTSAAQSIIRRCLELGIGLRINPSDDCVTVSDKAPPSLRDEIEQHYDEIKMILEGKSNESEN